MRILLRPLVPGVAEADGPGQTADRRRVAGEEVPRRRRARPLVATEVGRLLRRRELRRLLRLEAHGDDLEVAARIEGEHLERAGQPVERHRAEHRALVVREGQHDRAPAEVVTELDRAPGLVAEDGVERHRVAEVLVEPDVAQDPRRLGRGRGRRGLIAVPGRGRTGQGQDQGRRGGDGPAPAHG